MKSATHVALFRNLNLGHAGSPTGAELIRAFGSPTAARSFQTNGTVVFEAADPDQVTATAHPWPGVTRVPWRAYVRAAPP